MQCAILQSDEISVQFRLFVHIYYQVTRSQLICSMYLTVFDNYQLTSDTDKINSYIFQAPRWAFLLCALGLFIYQSLDAIDGKQARRTNSNTPLGELFDHGCDALSTGLKFSCCFHVVFFVCFSLIL